MRSKKLFFPIILLIVAVLATAVCSVVISIAKKPTVTEHEFPFSITYELNGEAVTINDVYKARYVGNDGYVDTKSRIYVGEIGGMGEGNTVYTLKQDKNTRVELWTNFYPDYLMGDSEGDYFDGGAFEPQIFYYDEQEVEYSDEETLSAQGVKLISFEYPTPIENSLVFSHISYFSSAVIWPSLLFAFLAWLLIVIFVKKENGLVRKPVDVVSIVINYIITFTLLPFSTICAWLLDIVGDNDHMINQVFYFIPALTVLGIAASVALRRKGYSKSALIVEFIGPAVFGSILLIGAILGWL
jgi:hypothetical protein